jgi:hypothetical protein
MFTPLKYGIERANIGIGEFLVRCPCCETDQWAEVMVSSVYSHFYYIPLFPNDKDTYVCCEKCGLKRYGVPFNADLIKNYQDVKGNYRHPWYTYIGAGIIVIPLLFWFIFFLASSF